MSIETELLEFAQTRPTWQQDLIRRICTQPDLSADDLAQALQNLKAAHGLAEGQELICVAEEHLSQRDVEAHTRTVLAVISDVRNANSLAPKQICPFAVQGITIIYGENGSGKTGYTRIAKQLCRARRDKNEPLLGNVYEPSSGPARAKITYLVGNDRHEFDWEDGTPAPPELSRISIFDATTAPLYADHQNAIEFLPLGLDVLPRLGKACERLAHQLTSEISTLETSTAVALPRQVPGSKADTLSQSLTLDAPEDSLPSEEEIRRAASWGSEEEVTLGALEEELRKYSEPARAAAQTRRLKSSLEASHQPLEVVRNALSSDAVARYRAQFDKTKTAREAALLAGRGRFTDDPLGRLVGRDAWRKLFEFAEKFSAEAYPGEPFPSTGPGRVCPLCQQVYSDTAADRMKRFRSFVEDTSQKEAEKEALTLRGFGKAVDELKIPTPQELAIQLIELTAQQASFEPIRSKLLQFIAEASGRKLAVQAALRGERSFNEIGGFDESALDAAMGFASGLEGKAKAYDEAVSSDTVIQSIRCDHLELLGRRQLSGSLETVLSRHADILTYHWLRRCKDECDTNLISRKNSEFRNKYLTADFKRHLKAEVDGLGLGYLPIKIDAKTEKGTSYVGVGLEKTSTARNSSILSEGEFRALALACFLAEIACIPNHDGIIVDDPVSSLDHRHIGHVATRLVEEAKRRPQVIVFTHDLSFYYELWSAAAEAGVPTQPNLMYWNRDMGFGIVDHGKGPWPARKTKDGIIELDQLLKLMPAEGTVTPNEHAGLVRGFYTRLRETWERLVEERLLNGVAARFQSEVKTLSLRGVTVTDEDHRTVFFAMKKASEHSGHDWAIAREGTLPTKSAMLEDLARLQEYEKQLSKREKEVSTHRRALEEPPKASTAQGPPG